MNKKYKRELKRKEERSFKKKLLKTKKGKQRWKDRKINKFVSQLMQAGYTEKEARIKAKNIEYIFN